MGDKWTVANKQQQIAISEGLLRSIEAKGFELTQEDVAFLFKLYDLRSKGENGKLPNEVRLQAKFTEIIEKYHLAH